MPGKFPVGMGKFEHLAFSSDQVLLEKILLWKRFIDDILMLFKGSKEECEILVEWLNNLVRIYFLHSCPFTFYSVAHLLSTQLRIYFLLSCAFTFYWTGHQPLPPELGISDSGDG